MEPLSIVTISAAVGGLAGKVIEKAWDSGEKWITDKFKSHQQKAIEQAKENGLAFLGQMGQRLHQLEEAVKNDKEKIAAITNVLEDPDFSASFQNSLLSAARTNDEEKHKLLARILIDRLNAKDDSVLKVTTDMAIDAVRKLTKNQLKILALLTLIYQLRPTVAPTFEAYIVWIKKSLSPYVDLEIKHIDIQHLLAVSCIEHEQFVSRDLKSIFNIPTVQGEQENYAKFFDTDPIGQAIHKLWQDGLQKAYPNSLGQTIGAYVNDELTGQNTVIDW